MNRYSLAQYVCILLTVVLGVIYALPSFYGQVPALRVQSIRAPMDQGAWVRMAEVLKKSGIAYYRVDPHRDLQSKVLQILFRSVDAQMQAKDVLEKALLSDGEPLYTIALDLVSPLPNWLTVVHAAPVRFGLDLRGGIHFLLEVDRPATVKNYLDTRILSIRTMLRSAHIPHLGIENDARHIRIAFLRPQDRDQACLLLANSDHQLDCHFVGAAALSLTPKPSVLHQAFEEAVKKNVTILHNRINDIGITEPIIQQQGANRIVVELPGIQNMTKAKRILGKTAALELHRVVVPQGSVPFPRTSLNTAVYDEILPDGQRQPLWLDRRVILTGAHITRATSGFTQNNEVAIFVGLDAVGTRIFRNTTRDHVGERLAIVLVEKNNTRVITAPRIHEEIPSGQIQITGHFTANEASELAVLLRAGTLAAPMNIMEERTVGPSLGADNVARGSHATMGGLAAIAIFMILYYGLFGLISVVALCTNLIFLVALLSILQATLTMPGIAAIALTLGMAIDANVLITERIREELRNHVYPALAIREGYQKAFSTIIDSNVTTFIAGLSLLIFGSGPIRGFAVVHCLGIVTSLYSSVFVSRALVNLTYGYRRRLQKVSIGQVWVPHQHEQSLQPLSIQNAAND